MKGAEVLALMARLADRAHACGLSGLRFELGDKAEAARVAEIHRRGFREAGLYSHGIPVDVTSFEPWQVTLKGELSESGAEPSGKAEPLSGWLASAESVAKDMERRAVARFHGVDRGVKANSYVTDSGTLEALCDGDGSPFWTLAYRSPATAPLLSKRASRAEAVAMIAARMESRLS